MSSSFTDENINMQPGYNNREIPDELRLLCENAGYLMARISPTGEMRFLSSACISQLGYQADELRGQQFYQLIHPDDQPALQSMMAEIVAKQKQSASLSLRLGSKDGHYYWFDASYGLLDDGQEIFAIAHNIHEHKKMEDSLRRQGNDMQTILQYLSEGLMVANHDGKILFWNKATLAMHGVARHENKELQLAELLNNFELLTLNGLVLPADDWPIARLLRGAPVNSLKLYVRRIDVDWNRIFCFNGELVHRPDGSPQMAVLSMQDITERVLGEQRVYAKVTHDQLTDLPNRDFLLEHVNREIVAAKRKKGKLAVFYLDLDRFKVINDQHGKEIGDRVLKVVARRIADTIRQSDFTARIGSDEFAILINDFREFDALRTLVARILQALKVPVTVAQSSFHVSASIGISCYPQDSESAEGMLAMADAAMYYAKHHHTKYSFVLKK